MAQQQQKTKGNPASKRMTNPRNAERRARSWKRGREKKELRIEIQKEAEKKNKKLREQGLPTPWEEAKEARRGNRKV